MDTNVVETEDKQPIIEHKQKPWIKILAFALLAMLLLSLLFIWNNNVIAPQTTSKPTQIISISPSIPFQKKVETGFICPSSEYVNCMPGPGPKNKQCSSEYLQWAQENCSNFKGAAY